MEKDEKLNVLLHHENFGYNPSGLRLLAFKLYNYCKNNNHNDGKVLVQP